MRMELNGLVSDQQVGRENKLMTFLVYKTLLEEDGSASVISAEIVPSGHHVPPDMGEMIEAEKSLLNNEEFKKAVAKLDYHLKPR